MISPETKVKLHWATSTSLYFFLCYAEVWKCSNDFYSNNVIFKIHAHIEAAPFSIMDNEWKLPVTKSFRNVKMELWTHEPAVLYKV